MKKNSFFLVLAILTLYSSQAFAAPSFLGNISYSGSATGTIYIAAFTGPGCGNGTVADNTDIPGPGAYYLYVPNGAYYICACLDADNSGTCPDNSDPIGEYQNNPATYSGTPVTNIDITLYDPASVPTLTEWGMIFFMALAGIGAVAYLRRQRRTER